MIAIPLTKNFSWRNPPWLTIVLILINCFVFPVFQGDEDRYRDEAMQFYFQSSLGKLETEFYGLYLQRHNLPPLEEDKLFQKLSDKERPYYCFHKIFRDTQFNQELSSAALVPDTDSRMQEWRQLRPEFDQKMESVVSYRFGFRPAAPRPLTWFSYMFLHGSWGHLIGNMIFLWLIGALIEYGCRHVVFPFIYVLGGFGAAGLFWVLNSASNAPLVGASGAIAGIMGAFTVLYGLKRVSIFLNLGFYFNYLKFPAILLLPLWMGNELFQLLFDKLSPVAYAAHLGGLGVGAVLAYGAKLIPSCLDQSAFVPAEDYSVAPLIEEALNHMGTLAFADARVLLQKALDKEPENLAVWQHLFTIDRQSPETQQFHQTTATLLDLLCRDPELAAKACAIFQEYSKVAKPPRLSVGHYLRVSQCFIASGDLESARRILWALAKKAKNSEELPMALFRLAQAYQRKRRDEAYQECLRLIQTQFPMSDVARVAGAQLKKA
ncbi:MAG: rhomboid family intramembrane serine protease [Desulfobacteraceae bacterium]|nr:rhomboid family intramembrane serine protease [Desulfobacteraceae bacterium]